MSKVIAGKKKGRKKKAGKVSSPDLLNNVLPQDLDLDGDLELSSLEYEHFKPPHIDGVERQDNSDEPMFPHELHMALKNKIQGLEEEKEELATKLRKAEERLAASSPLRNIGRSSDLAASRIVELGKKVKELQAQLRKQISSKKSPDSSDLMGGGDGNNMQLDDGDNADSGSCCGKIKVQLGDMTEKYNTANAKLCELRNQNQHLRHENKLAAKALSCELGEKVNVMNILSGTQGWRGRAQQILSLQQKVNELTEKLALAQGQMNISERCASRERDRVEVDSLKSETESLKAEGEQLKSDITDTRRKLEESKARVRSLQAELGALRQANSTMGEKMAADRKHIDCLNIQLESLNEKAKGKEHVLNNRYEQQLASMKRDLTQEKQRNEQLQEVLKEKDSKILQLQMKSAALGSSFSLPEFDNSESRCVSAITRSASLDKEITNNSSCDAERTRLMELVGVNARRLQEERKNTASLEEQLRSERHRCARLETKLARLELERIGWAKGQYKKPPPVEPSSYRSENDWDSLKDKAELYEEKCLALESRLKTLQQEKEEDNRRFIQIIDEQRTTYNELQRKTNSS